MSREIKFRVWGKTEKEYIRYPFAWLSLFDSPDSLEIEENEDLVIEQYTGLKDKNGKEVYEGDIVKARWYRAKRARLDTKGEVKFADGWFYIDDDPDGQDRLGVPVHNCYSIEVIGNIHENPGLLGGKE